MTPHPSMIILNLSMVAFMTSPLIFFDSLFPTKSSLASPNSVNLKVFCDVRKFSNLPTPTKLDDPALKNYDSQTIVSQCLPVGSIFDNKTTMINMATDKNASLPLITLQSSKDLLMILRQPKRDQSESTENIYLLVQSL